MTPPPTPLPLIQVLITINLLASTAFAGSHKFWYALFSQLGVGVSLWIVWRFAEGGIYDKCVSQPFLFQCRYFLIHPMCSASFWISFRGNFSMGSCTFGASAGEGKFKSLLRCHLRNYYHKKLFFFFKSVRVQKHNFQQ